MRRRMSQRSAYSRIIEKIFISKFVPGLRRIAFEREDIARVAKELGLDLPKNLGDLIYSFRYRADLPDSIQSKAHKGETWIIRLAGQAKYRFELVPDVPLVPNDLIVTIKVPEATPGIVAKYALNDEQALLARVRYNRLLDIFLGVACYSLQNHLRTTVAEMGQVETDELYVGVDKKGVHYVVPVQAKGGRDNLSIVQIEQDVEMCRQKFPSLVCRPVGAQFMRDGTIALFAFEHGQEGVGIVSEKHYKLVPPEEVTESDLAAYATRPSL